MKCNVEKVLERDEGRHWLAAAFITVSELSPISNCVSNVGKVLYVSMLKKVSYTFFFLNFPTFQTQLFIEESSVIINNGLRYKF